MVFLNRKFLVEELVIEITCKTRKADEKVLTKEKINIKKCMKRNMKHTAKWEYIKK